MSLRTVTFQTIQTGWGIRVTLSGYRVNGETHHPCFRLSKSVIVVDGLDGRTLSRAEIAQLSAASLIFDNLIQRRTQGEVVQIVITDLSYIETDFQPDGICAAMYMWLSEEFGLNVPDPKVQYVKSLGRYEFTWPTLSD